MNVVRPGAASSSRCRQPGKGHLHPAAADQMLALAGTGIRELVAAQKGVLESA
jgi:hypothetical protein